jgi:hypothetical protein
MTRITRSDAAQGDVYQRVGRRAVIMSQRK